MADTDYKQLCAELYAIFEKYDDESNLAGIRYDLKSDDNDILDRARDALDEPRPESELGNNTLSPAAYAVVAAAHQQGHTNRLGLAAALRAVAEQVGPSESLPPGYAYSAPAEKWHYEFKLKAQRQILAIASELEGQA